MKNLVKKIQDTAHQHNLWGKNSKIVLGVSGGPDSICLLQVFLQLQKKYPLELIIAHVNYGLRGKDSEADEKFVRELAEKNNLKLEVFPKAKLSEIPKLSFRKSPSENELRDIRYDFFEKIRTEKKFDLIAVAHNSDDQVETYLMRILRGAGLQGLSAMKFSQGKIIRPLLGISRKEILEFLRNGNLTYRTDKTNAESLFLRNKIRNKLIPQLEKNYNPSIRKTIFDATVSIAQDYDYINEVAKKVYQKNKDLSVSKLLALHPAIQRRVLLQAIAEKKMDTQNIELSHIEEILKALKSTKGKNQTFSCQGLKMTRKGDKVTISYN
ncbi:MAG: tRNA(Ile)-lysidine synthase [Candidatus Moranbacteria bacterium GW2011_GWA2_39_41]|nr:MAG: tRNA(Ile)-lysidine synthase [Candidatus Moranbacteria bacterium GW2011_GWA2_39_41]